MSEALTKILYVEDDEDIAELTQMVLRKLGGFEVAHAPTGEGALELFAQFRPQLVLSDVMMPGMDGPEVLRRIRALPEGGEVPVVFMTAKAQTHEQEGYKALGVLGVIVKPVDPMELCSEIKRYWGECRR